MKISELAKKLGAEHRLGPEGDVELIGIGTIQDSVPGFVTFLTNPKYEGFLSSTKASAVILSELKDDCAIAQIVHKTPHFAFAQTAQTFFKLPISFQGIHEQAFVSPEAKISSTATIYPFSYVGAGAEIGDRSIVFPFAYVGENSQVGKDTMVRAHSVIEYGCQVGDRVVIHAGAVVGADGFGFASDGKSLTKVPQFGSVVIENEVEVGSLSNIHRGAIGETRIGEGTKLDSLVHIAHNVKTGKYCMFCGQTGIAGSATIGDWAATGGQTAINGHITIGDHYMLGARGVVTEGNENPTGAYHGFPARPAMEFWREQSMIKKLPDLNKQMRSMQKKIAELTAKLEAITQS